jgi:hypothetical protein
MYCLCVNVYCTTATRCQPNCSWQICHLNIHCWWGISTIVIDQVPAYLVFKKYVLCWRQNLNILSCSLQCKAFKVALTKYVNTTLFKKRPHFLNSASTSTESALRLLSVPSVGFWQQTAICPVLPWALVVEVHPLNWARSQAVRCVTNFALTLRIWSFWFKIWWQDPVLMPTSSATFRTVKPDARCAQFAAARALCWLACHLKSSVCFWSDV